MPVRRNRPKRTKGLSVFLELLTKYWKSTTGLLEWNYQFHLLRTSVFPILYQYLGALCTAGNATLRLLGAGADIKLNARKNSRSGNLPPKVSPTTPMA